MKREEKEKMRAKSKEELQHKLEEKKKKLVEAKFKLSQGQLENLHLPSKLRKGIAVVKTIMTEKTISSKKGREQTNE